MNREEIMRILPHREPMLLLDDVEEQDGESVGHYAVRGDEFFLTGHFPGNPIVPWVILCEILAPSACVLFAGRDEGRGADGLHGTQQREVPVSRETGGPGGNPLPHQKGQASFLFCGRQGDRGRQALRIR